MVDVTKQDLLHHLWGEKKCHQISHFQDTLKKYIVVNVVDKGILMLNQ